MRICSLFFVITCAINAATPELVFQNYFGAGPSDTAGLVATDAQGNVYVAGTTNSVNFPIGSNITRPGAAPLLAASNNATAVTGLPILSERSVTAIGGDATGAALYAATPDGIFISADAGNSWQQAPALPLNGQPAPSVNAIVVDPLDSSRVYLATSNGMFGTADAGRSWFTLDDGLAASASGAIQATSVAISAKDHSHFFATTGNPSYLYRSTNTGAQWFELNPVYPGEVFSPYINFPIVFTLDPVTENLYAINSGGVLLESMDDGDTWNQLSGGLYGARSIMLDPNNASHIYVVDNSGLVQSTDGGMSFTATNPPNVSGQNVRAIALDPQSGTLYLSTQTAVYVSNDRGATWTFAPGVSSPNIHALAFLGGRLLIARDSPSSVYVIKFDPSGRQILFTTFFGGTISDTPVALAIESSGAAVVAGVTSSPDFPVTPGAFQSSFPSSPATSQSTAFLTKISPDGSRLLYSTLLGPAGTRMGALTLDPAGNAYITGAGPANFPTTAGVLQPNVPAAQCTRPNPTSFFGQVNVGAHAFVAKLSADGAALGFSTFLTGTCGSVGRSIALDSAQDVIVGGTTTSPDMPVSTGSFQDAYPGSPNSTSGAFTVGFVAKLSPAADKLLAGTYLGGGFETAVNSVTLDASGNIAAAGETWGLAKGISPGAYQPQIAFNCTPVINIGPSPPPSNGYDAFVIKLDPALQSSIAGTYLGGGCLDSASTLAFDKSGNAWIAGNTQSQDFPPVAPFGGVASGVTFVSELDPDFSQLLFSSYIDQSTSLAIAPDGNVFLPGRGLSGGAYLANIDPSQTLQVIINKVSAVVSPVLNPPSALLGGIAPGELIRITGQNLGPADSLPGQLDDTGRLATKLGSTEVFVNGIPAPLASVQADSITCLAPFEILGAQLPLSFVPNTSAQVQVRNNGAVSNAVKVGVVTIATEILVITNQDGSVNSASNPASPGSGITLYVSGLGQTNPPGVDGLVNVAPLPVPLLAPASVNVNGQSVTPSFVAGAPGLAAGITQINLTLPASGYTQNTVNINVSTTSATLYVGSAGTSSPDQFVSSTAQTSSQPTAESVRQTRSRPGIATQYPRTRL